MAKPEPTPPADCPLHISEPGRRRTQCDVLPCLYLRTHQWDKRESIHYEANSSSFLPNCSSHHPCLAAVAWAQQGIAKGVALGSCWLRVCPKPAGTATLPMVARPPWLCGTLGSAALQGEQLHLKPGHQAAGKIPEPALCLSPQCSSS